MSLSQICNVTLTCTGGIGQQAALWGLRMNADAQLRHGDEEDLTLEPPRCCFRRALRFLNQTCRQVREGIT